MSTGHWTVRVSGHRWVAYCTTHCHHPIGAWDRDALLAKIRSL